jgi:hypothetical protein
MILPLFPQPPQSKSAIKRHGSIPGYVAAVRQNAGKLAMIGEIRVLANYGYGTPICQTLNQAHKVIIGRFNGSNSFEMG